MPRALLIAEAANPDWVSVPLVGWSLATAIARAVPAHFVTHVRNRVAIAKAGLIEGRDFTAIDSDAVARPLWRAANFLRGPAGAGWTTSTALSALSYYYFEALLWRQFKGRILAGEFDIVHRITPLSPTIPSILAERCRRAGVPFVIGPLNGGAPWPKGFDSARRKEREWLSYVRSAYKLLPAYRSTLHSAAALIVGSGDTLRQVPDAYRHKCIYLPENAIDPAKFSPAPAASMAGSMRACFVGRLVPYKGPDMVLEALAPLLRDRRLLLDIIGDGPLLPELRAYVARESLDQGVTLHGWVEHRRVPELMRRSRLFVFPSIREFGGGAVLEAMALGLVPVVVDYAGPGELVVDGTGYKVPIGRREEIVASLRKTIAAICERPEELATMSGNARERVTTLFTWDIKARQMLQVYDWVLGRQPEKPDFFSARASALPKVGQ